MKFDMSGAASVLGHAARARRHAGAGQRGGRHPDVREHARRPRDQARRHRHHAVGPDGRDPQHRRRRAASSCATRSRTRRASSPRRSSISPRSPAPASSRSATSPRGLFANDETLADEIREAADDAWDRVWQMPLWEDYQEQLRSNFADFANIGGRPGGSITAACFLARFTRETALGAPRHRRHRLEKRPREGLHRAAGAAAGALRHATCRQQQVTATIDFYFNAEDRLQVACRLAGKAIAQQKAHADLRARARDGEPHRQAAVDLAGDRLRAALRASHDPLAADTPVLIASAAETPPSCELLLNLGARMPAALRALRAPARSRGGRRRRAPGRPQPLSLLPRARLQDQQPRPGGRRCSE